MDISRSIVKKLRESRLLQEKEDYASTDRNDLIKMAQGGDQYAFQVLLDQHKDFIYRMTHKYFVPGGDKEDLIQVAHYAFWKAVDSWNFRGDFEAYAGMLIKRDLTDEVRKLDTEKANFNRGADSLDRVVKNDGSASAAGNSNEMTLGDITPSSDLSPEDLSIGKKGYDNLVKFMREELSDTERRVILRYIDGYKVSEIAEVENMKYKSVENALRRTKEKISDYRKNVRESRDIKKSLSEGSIFTDEEKRLLKTIITDIDGADEFDD